MMNSGSKNSTKLVYITCGMTATSQHNDTAHGGFLQAKSKTCHLLRSVSLFLWHHFECHSFCCFYFPIEKWHYEYKFVVLWNTTGPYKVESNIYTIVSFWGKDLYIKHKVVEYYIGICVAGGANL